MSLVLLRTQSDERLVALARDGHERAFEAIVKRYRRPLLAVCRRMVPEARAEDVLQQALVSAWRALRRGDQVNDLRPWLFRIARNAAVSNLRRTGVPDPPELLDTLVAAASPQEEAERREVVQETLEAVAGLPERQRQALLRIAVQGRSQDEVAEELGVSRIAVRQLVHRARVTLRSAASAVLPFPLVAWLASAGTGAEPMSLRIAQLVAGAGGAGAGATLVKAGAVAGVAAAVSTPILTERHPPPRAIPAAATATPRPVTAASLVTKATATPRAVPVASVVPKATATPRATPAAPAVPAAPSPQGRQQQRKQSDGEDSGGGDRSRDRTTTQRSAGDDHVSSPAGAGSGGSEDAKPSGGPTAGSADDEHEVKPVETAEPQRERDGGGEARSRPSAESVPRDGERDTPRVETPSPSRDESGD
jgi:RNA polymerase sigma factor (sigma-70 family)